MKRSPRILLGLAAGLVALAGALWALTVALGDHETLYQGKSFDYWCAELASPDAAASNRASLVVSTVIIPQLTHQMFADTNDSTLRTILVDQLNGLPGLHIDFTPAEGRRIGAVNNLGALGPRAKEATAPLLTMLKLKDDTTCGVAAGALVKIQAEPDALVPALIGCLVDENGRGRADVVEALGEFGPKAAAAVPELVKLLQDQSSKDIMRTVPLALKQIDPQAAAKAGVR